MSTKEGGQAHQGARAPGLLNAVSVHPVDLREGAMHGHATPWLQCDIAMLTVDDDAFWTDDVQGLQVHGGAALLVACLRQSWLAFADLLTLHCPALRSRALCPCSCGVVRAQVGPTVPLMQESVSVVGFPCGGDNVCVTKGVVSRIDRQLVRPSGRQGAGLSPTAHSQIHSGRVVRVAATQCASGFWGFDLPRALPHK